MLFTSQYIARDTSIYAQLTDTNLLYNPSLFERENDIDKIDIIHYNYMDILCK